MYTAGMALAFLAALLLELTGHSRAVSGPFIIAGLVFLVLAILFPPRRPPGGDR